MKYRLLSIINKFGWWVCQKCSDARMRYMVKVVKKDLGYPCDYACYEGEAFITIYNCDDNRSCIWEYFYNKFGGNIQFILVDKDDTEEYYPEMIEGAIDEADSQN